MSRSSKFTPETERLFIEHAISDPDALALARKGFDPSYFSEAHRPAVKAITEYWDEYRKAPTREIMEAQTGSPVGNPDYEVDGDWFKAEFKEFYDYNTQLNAITEALEKLDTGDLAAVREKVYEDTGTELFPAMSGRDLTETEWLIELLMESTEGIYPFGWPSIDWRLGGGVKRQTTTLFVARTGGGKSIALSNVSLNLAEQGLRVLFISAEMRVGDIMRRHLQMLTGRKCGGKVQKQDIAPTLKELEKVDYRGNVKVEHMESPKAVDVSALLARYALEGREFDCVVLDYLDLCEPNDPDMMRLSIWERDKHMAWEMKRMAERNDIIFISACQTNSNVKDRKPGEHYDQTMIAGGQDKARVADNIIFMENIGNEEEIREAEEHNKKENKKKEPELWDVPEYEKTGQRMFLVKCRFSAAGASIDMKWDAEWLRIRDNRAATACHTKAEVRKQSKDAEEELKKRMPHIFDKGAKNRRRKR